jgi:ABC-type Fe3+/spermidine/putrescine transport system ATPase subunit
VSAVTDPSTARRSPDPILSVRGLTKIYGAARVVNDVSFDLNTGEVVTLLGPSGCGKSTTLRLIAGLDQPDAGEVFIRGRLVASAARQVMIPPEKRRVGLVFQSYAIWPHMTVAENIGYPLKVRRIDSGTVAAKVAEMIQLMKLDGLAGRMPTQLSGGQQQRVALARALVYEPTLLLLDEPLSNLDLVLRREMRAQLKELQSRLAMTVLYVTHDQEEAMSLSSRVVVMNGGVVEQIGPPEAVYEQPATPFVQDFVGRTIRLHGVTEGSAERPRVRIGSSVIEIAGSDHGRVHPGTAVEVWMRPEDVLLRTKSDPPNSCLAGHIIEVAYYGDRLECALRIEGTNEQVVVSADKRLVVVKGDRIFLDIQAAHLRVWPS